MDRSITVHLANDADATWADTLADRLGLPRDDAGELLLVVTPMRLELRAQRSDDPGLLGGHGVSCELIKLDTSSPAGRSRKAPLLRAVWPRRWPDPPRVLDATAGLGEDAWLLASHGCAVTAVERDPVVHALLEDGLRRAADARPETASRIDLRHADAADVLGAWVGRPPDVVMIDPMFPSGRKALERKPMRVLRRVVDLSENAGSIRDAAQRLGVRRVVVKRLRLGPSLDGVSPDRQIVGKAIRFDIYEGATQKTESRACQSG